MMIGNYLLLCLFSISACFLASTVARKSILGGNAVHGYSTYRVSIQIHGRGHICGGGIIHDLYVLTAARCVIINNERRLRSRHMYIVAGTNNFNRTESPALTIRVDEVFFPKEFHATLDFTYGNIAVLKLASSLQLGRNRRLEKLEFPRTFDPPAGSELIISGFGWNHINRNHGNGSSDGYLRYASSSILEYERCERAFPREAIDISLHICAETHHAAPFDIDNIYGVCTGDEGGPLVQRSNRVIFGILVRVPPNCDERGVPPIYTRLTYYLDMIFNIMLHGSDDDAVSVKNRY